MRVLNSVDFSRWIPAGFSFSVLLFLAAYIGGLFYIFPSGYPQPADFAVPILFISVLSRLPRGAPIPWLLTAWILAVNLWWAVALSDWLLLRPVAFFAFNVVFMISTFALAADSRVDFHGWLRIAAISSSLLELGVVLFEVGGIRQVGSFNNPNQLGYWAVLNVSCLALSLKDNKIGYVDLIAIAATMFACVVSLSRSAIFSALLAALLMFLFQKPSPRLVIAGAVGMVISLLFVFFISDRTSNIFESKVVDSWQAREEVLDQRGGNDIIDRGYDRLFIYPEYLLFGSGEGAYYRFSQSVLVDLEMHSTVGNFILSYGVIGLLLAIAFLGRLYRAARLKEIAYSVPILMYGITHNGIRFSWLWIFFGVVAATSMSRAATKWRRPHMAYGSSDKILGHQHANNGRNISGRLR